MKIIGIGEIRWDSNPRRSTDQRWVCIISMIYYSHYYRLWIRSIGLEEAYNLKSKEKRPHISLQNFKKKANIHDTILWNCDKPIYTFFKRRECTINK